MIERFLKLFRRFRESEAQVQSWIKQYDRASDNYRAEVEQRSALERKLSEVTTERDSWQKQALDWQQRYSEKDADLVNVLKRSTDALYIKATGMSMYGTAEPTPPQQVDMEKVMGGQRLTQAEIRAKAQVEVARKAMEYLHLKGGPPDQTINKTGDELVEFFKQEQEQFVKLQ
jgi:hypothetical protein